MSERSTALNEKIRQLRLTFLDNLVNTLAEIGELCNILNHGEADQRTLDDLYRSFHSIKGSAGSFGLVAISSVGAAGEDLVRQIQQQNEEGNPPPLLAEIMVQILARVQLLDSLRQAAANAPEDAPEDAKITLPSFPPLRSHFKNSKQIYICEDDTVQAEHLAAQLTCFGYSVTVFNSPEPMKIAILEAQPDAIIMDIIFSDSQSQGLDFMAGLQRDMHSPPPAVFVSSRQDFEARLRSVQAGSEAYFIKPVKANELTDTLDILTNAQKPEPFRVLLVDDELEVASYHSLILEQAGMVTQVKREPAEVLDVLIDFKPDLVLMDMHMPTCSGRDLSRVIRQMPEFIGLPILFLSAETDKDKQLFAMNVGAEGFITKPVEPSDLINAVTVRAERMRSLRVLMARDGLTGLFNHTFILQFLRSAMATAERNSARLCVAMIDMDYFKRVNDTHGHPAGDQVLIALSRLLQQRLRSSDLVGRYGGEEFLLILNDVGMTEAVGVIDTLRRDFSQIRFQFADQEVSCTFSAGISSFPPLCTAELLVNAADQALYVAKRQGRNRVMAFSETM